MHWWMLAAADLGDAFSRYSRRSSSLADNWVLALIVVGIGTFWVALHYWDKCRKKFFPDANDAYVIKHLQKAPIPKNALTSTETRHVEFELRPSGKGKLPNTLQGSAYYYVCEDVNGQCLFLRQPVTIPLE